MMRELKAHPYAYSLLAIVVTATVVGYLAAWPYRAYQRGIAIVFGSFYFVWGALTHLHADHITRRILLEYAGVALLVVLILIGLTV